jgi:transforming growth factor-beta-induced protein
MTKYVLPLAILALMVLAQANAGRVVLSESDEGSGSDDSDSDEKCKSIAQILTTDPKFSILLSFLDKLNLTKDLGPELAVTFFAPTNAAFEKLLATIGSVPDDDDVLEVLQYHSSFEVKGKGAFTKKGTKINTFLETEKGKFATLTLQKPQNVITEGKQTVKASGPFYACKAIGYVVDTVLLPFEL